MDGDELHQQLSQILVDLGEVNERMKRIILNARCVIDALETLLMNLENGDGKVEVSKAS